MPLSSSPSTGRPAPAYITTPIYYVNDRPHIGHAYTTTLCDVWGRAMRMDGRDVFFLTGTDEHGVKVEKSAKDRGITPQALADENSAEFRKVMGLFGLTNDDFIRTTEPRHESQVKLFVERLLKTGDIYLGEFVGWYDEGQEEYVTETRAKELDYKSPISGKPLVRATEKNYYFRLSAYQQKLEAFFAERGLSLDIVGEFDDSALLKVCGARGRGVFLAPTVIEAEVVRQFDVQVVGRTDEIEEAFYAISVERRLRHPAVVALAEAARSDLFKD